MASTEQEQEIDVLRSLARSVRRLIQWDKGRETEWELIRRRLAKLEEFPCEDQQKGGGDE